MSQPTDSQNEPGHGFQPVDLLVALRRRFWLIVLIGSLGGGIATTIALLLPNKYEAVATVQIDPRKKTIVSLDAVLPDIAGDTPTIESQVEILKSRVIALRVIDALGLRQDPEFADERDASAANPYKAAAAAKDADAIRRRSVAAQEARSASGPDAESIGTVSPERDAVAANFSDRLRTVRVRNSLVVEIRFNSRDPVKAARIANTIAEVYIRDQIDMKVKATGLAADLLEPKLDGLRAKVADAERKIARFKAEHGIFDAEGQLLSEKQLARLMEQTVVARNATAEARARFDHLQEMIKSGRGRNIAEVLQSATVRMHKDQLAKATQKEAELLSKYGPKHPEIARARAEVQDVDRQIAAEIERIVANVKNEYQVATDRERMLDQSLEQLKEEQSISKEVTVILRDLEREAETSRRVFETFLARYKQTLETQDLHLPDARIVERADVPIFPVGPKRKQIVLIGLIAGLGLGAGLGLLLELMKTGIARPDETEARIGVPLLAAIPRLKRESDGFGDPMMSLRLRLAQPNGQFSRAIDELALKLDQRRTDGAPRTILVTACLPNEGTTVISSNLALAMGARGGRTLIVDADLRRSKLTRNLGLLESPGLIDAIAFGQDFESVILKDSVSGVAIIPSGQVGRSALMAADVLQAPGFAQRLALLKSHFDTIIIDAPPLLPVVDARILANYADQIVMVATWRKTSVPILRRAIQTLRDNQALLTGLVLNQMDPHEVETQGAPAANPARLRPPRRRAA